MVFVFLDEVIYYLINFFNFFYLSSFGKQKARPRWCNKARWNPIYRTGPKIAMETNVVLFLTEMS